MGAHQSLQVLRIEGQHLLLCHRNQTDKAHKLPSRRAIVTHIRRLSHPIRLSKTSRDRSHNRRGQTMALLHDGNSKLTLPYRTERDKQATA
jgi:hypothetical protein